VPSQDRRVGVRQEAGDKGNKFDGPEDSPRQAVQYRLRTLLLVVTILAAVGGVYAGISRMYYVQVRRLNAVLADFPQIDEVWLATNDDATLEVEEVYFTVREKPGVIFKIDGIDGAASSEIRSCFERALREQVPASRPSWVTKHR
jgi:hypothetical protein